MDVSELISSLFTLIVGCLVFAGIFLLIRSIVIWYFKIDLVIKELQEQNTHLKVLVGLMMHDPNRKSSHETPGSDALGG